MRVIRKSYTLLELVAAVAILLIVMGVGVVSFSNLRLDKSPIEQAERLRRMAALCRRSAVAQGKTQTLFWHHETRQLQFGKESIVLSENMTLTVNNKVSENNMVLIRFFPDGNASETMIAIADSNENAILTVSPLTGMVEVYEKE